MANFSVGKDFPAIFCFSPGTCLQCQDIQKHLSSVISSPHTHTKPRKRFDVTQINSHVRRQLFNVDFDWLWLDFIYSSPFILLVWVQQAVCTWTECTLFPRMLDSHLQSACWGKPLSCTRKLPEKRRRPVRTAVPSSSDGGKGAELPRAWRDTRAAKLPVFD